MKKRFQTRRLHPRKIPPADAFAPNFLRCVAVEKKMVYSFFITTECTIDYLILKTEIVDDWKKASQSIPTEQFHFWWCNSFPDMAFDETVGFS